MFSRDSLGRTLNQTWFFGRKRSRLADLATEIASQNVDALVASMPPKTFDMGAAELSGYVRAHAAGHVQRDINVAAAAGHIKPGGRPELTARAAADLTILAVRELLKGFSPAVRPARAA